MLKEYMEWLFKQERIFELLVHTIVVNTSKCLYVSNESSLN